MWGNNSSLLYTVMRERNCSEIPITLENTYLRRKRNPDREEEIIEEKSAIIDLRSLCRSDKDLVKYYTQEEGIEEKTSSTTDKDLVKYYTQEEGIEEKPIVFDFSSVYIRSTADRDLLDYYRSYVIYKTIKGMIGWYKERRDFFGVKDKASIVEELKRQAFHPFLSEDDLLKITVVVRFYEKKEEEFIKKEERNVLTYTCPLGHIKLIMLKIFYATNLKKRGQTAFFQVNIPISVSHII